MNKKYLQGAAFMTLAVFLAGCSHHDGHESSDKHADKKMDSHMEKNHDDHMDHMDHKDHMHDMEKTSAHYEEYTPERFNELKGTQKFIVFFHADWCGTCIKWEKNVQAATSLPENTVILKANYDTDKDLVADLHVKSQSTAVFFDHKGEIVDALADPKVDVLSDFFSSENVDNITIAGEKYETYTEERFDALKGQQKMVLFFYADWCGTCRKWEKSLMSSLDSLPENTKVLKANYDTDTALKAEFGIKMQSVAAFIAADGSLAKTMPDPSMDAVAEFFSAAE